MDSKNNEPFPCSSAWRSGLKVLLVLVDGMVYLRPQSMSVSGVCFEAVLGPRWVEGVWRIFIRPVVR